MNFSIQSFQFKVLVIKNQSRNSPNWLPTLITRSISIPIHSYIQTWIRNSRLMKPLFVPFRIPNDSNYHLKFEVIFNLNLSNQLTWRNQNEISIWRIKFELSNWRIKEGSKSKMKNQNTKDHYEESICEGSKFWRNQYEESKQSWFEVNKSKHWVNWILESKFTTSNDCM